MQFNCKGAMRDYSYIFAELAKGISLSWCYTFKE